MKKMIVKCLLYEKLNIIVVAVDAICGIWFALDKKYSNVMYEIEINSINFSGNW